VTNPGAYNITAGIMGSVIVANMQYAWFKTGTYS